MSPPFALFRKQASPVFAVAVHHGHALRPEVAEWMALDEAVRLREEDPYTGRWARIAGSFAVANYSRFEVDLNRPPEQAVYATPGEAWGLNVWKGELPEHVVRESRERHAEFFGELSEALDLCVRRFGHVVLLDLHSYNHRRDGPDSPPAHPSENPDINIGTGTMDRDYWDPVVTRFIRDLRSVRPRGQSFDVRENVRFRGGYLPRWVHEHYPRSVCAIAVEVKKSFMDEWTGQLDEDCFFALWNAFRSTLSGLHKSLQRYDSGLVTST
jgi:N-formylglutamate amidohydrolase